jgi:hypothetical protein
MGFFVTIKFIHLFPTTNKRMRTILIIGAGRSASSLIHYLLNKSVQENLHLTIGDLSQELAQRKTNNHPNQGERPCRIPPFISLALARVTNPKIKNQEESR